MHVPCEASLHWHRITLVLAFGIDELDANALAKSLGMTSPEELGLVLSDSPDCHSHVWVERLEPDDVAGPGEPDAPFHSIRIRTYRFGADEPAALPHETFFKALAAAAPNVAEFSALAIVDLFYRVPPARWRIPLIANPPRFGELESDLGEIRLAGLTLRFDKSPVGLTDVSLEASPVGDEDRVSLTYGVTLARSDIEKVYDETLKKAERFSSLFVDAGAGEPSETAK